MLRHDHPPGPLPAGATMVRFASLVAFRQHGVRRLIMRRPVASQAPEEASRISVAYGIDRLEPPL
jgi:hypothetical protein